MPGEGDNGAQGAQGEGTQGQQGQQGGGGQEKTYTGADLSSKYSEGYNAGVDKAMKDLKLDIKKHFGVESFEDAVATLQKLQKSGSPDHVQQLEKMSQQLSEQENRHKTERLTWRVQSAIGGDAHNPQTAAEQIMRHYDIQVDEAGRETVVKRATKELVLADGKPVTTRDLVQLLSKDSEFAYLFKTGITSGVTGAQKQSKLNDSMLTDPTFVQALRSTDQYFAFINGKPVDEDKVLAAWKKS